MGSSLWCVDRHVDRDRTTQELLRDSYGAGVPGMGLPTSWSQTLLVVTVGGPANNPARFCWTQAAARCVDSSAPV